MRVHDTHISPILTPNTGNERLQEMMAIMAEERGGKVFAMDEKWADRVFMYAGTDISRPGSVSITAS
jgi:hypothetical protein